MRRLLLTVLCAAAALWACDSTRVYEKNQDFTARHWLVSEQPSFEFEVSDVRKPYNLYFNVRNAVSYPDANLYFTYYLTDSTGTMLRKALVSEFLFDRKTGEPFGSSVLGDIYDHQFLLLKDYMFARPGKYTMRYEQFMRRDTLNDILAVGLRVEHAAAAD